MVAKIKKYKTPLLGVGVILVALYICYLIGQNIVLPARMSAEGLLSYDDKMPQYSFLQNAKDIFYENQVAKEDVVGGQTTGLITLEDNTKVLFVTPGTALRSDITLEEQANELSFVCGYHPMIEAGITNGAVIKAEVISLEDESVLLEEEIYIADGEREQIVEIDLSGIDEKNIRVRLSCSCGEENDDNGDWIIVKYLVVE